MGKKMLFVFNPRSGKGTIKNKLFDIIDTFVKNGWDVDIHPTQNIDDAYINVVKRGRNFECVVASGGDGTLNETIRGLMTIEDNKRPTLGYIPAGTVNDFASNLGIPKNMKKAAENIVSGQAFKCDIGEFNQKPFIYVAAFGAFTNVSYETPQQNKNMFGQAAYLLEGIKQLHNLKSYKIKVICDDGEVEADCILGMVANSNHIAGMRTKAIKAQLNDGLFEVILIKRPTTIFELNDLISRLAIQDFNSDSFVVFRTANVKFIAEEEVPWTLDGEFGGSVKTADIKVKKEVITLLF